MLTQSPSFFAAGIPISSNVAGPVFFGGAAGPDDAVDGVTEECLESPDCDDMAVVGRLEARLALWTWPCIDSNLAGGWLTTGVPCGTLTGVIELPLSGLWN